VGSEMQKILLHPNFNAVEIVVLTITKHYLNDIPAAANAVSVYIHEL